MTKETQRLDDLLLELHDIYRRSEILGKELQHHLSCAEFEETAKQLAHRLEFVREHAELDKGEQQKKFFEHHMAALHYLDHILNEMRHRSALLLLELDKENEKELEELQQQILALTDRVSEKKGQIEEEQKHLSIHPSHNFVRFDDDKG